MIGYKTQISKEIERINEGMLKDGGQGLIPEGYIIGYDPVTDTYIYFRHLDMNNTGEEYKD